MMTEPYGVRGRQRLFFILLTQTFVFGAGFWLTCQPKAWESVSPRQAVAASMLIASFVVSMWLQSATLLAWTMRVEMPLAPILQRVVLTPLSILWAATSITLLMLIGCHVASEPLISSLLVILRAVGGLMTLLMAIAAGVSFHYYRRQGRYSFHLAEKLERFRIAHDHQELRRIQRWVEQEVRGVNPGIVIRGCAFPGLSSRAWYEAEEFDWIQKLEASWEEIREEAFRTYEIRKGYNSYIYPGVSDNRWKAFIIMNGGHETENAKRCPKTLAVLRSLPISLVREALFSVVEPGARIKPHRDSDNTTLTCQLALKAPEDCKIRVAGEARGWKDGKCIVFDTSYEHEVWNDSDEPRIVLLFDFLQPGLTPVEREFLTKG